MKGKFLFLLGAVLLAMACRSYDITTLLFQDDLKRQIAAGNLRIRLEEDQVPLGADLLLDEDPLIRLAALKIIENNRYDDFLIPLLETTLDEDDRVAKEAYRLLEAYPDWTLSFLENNLDESGDLLCLNSLVVLGNLNSPTSIPFMVGLFQSDSEKKKDGAARTLASLVSMNSPLMDSLKISEEPYERAGYYRIIAHYGEGTLIPLLFAGLGDDSPQVWGACITGISSFGEEALPFVDRYIETDDYLMILSCLQILEAIQSEKSLLLLISLYANPNQLLAQRAAIIVKSFGEPAVPFLDASLPAEELMVNRLGLWTLREINSPRAFPLYVELLDMEDDYLTDDIVLSLSALGEQVYPRIREQIGLIHREGTGRDRAVTLLNLLMDGGDDLITEDEICSYYLITAVGEEEFDSYLTLASLRADVKEDFRSLRRALTYKNLFVESRNVENNYFMIYLEMTELQRSADDALRNSLVLRRKGEKSRADEAYLLFESLEEQIAINREYLTSLPESEQKSGERLIFSYLNARREVVDIWVGISPRYRGLAERVYGELVEDMDQLIREVSRE